MTFVSTTQFYGIDVNAFAVEVAKVTLMLARKLAADELGDERAVLPLDDLDDNFIAADALTVDWPDFDVCIGNPPYLGRRRIVEERGAGYAAWLAEEFPDVGGVSDYVVYWFRKAHDRLPDGRRAGLWPRTPCARATTRKASLDYIDRQRRRDLRRRLEPALVGRRRRRGLDRQLGQGHRPRAEDAVACRRRGASLEVDEITGSLSTDVDVAEAAQLDVNPPAQDLLPGPDARAHEGFVLTPETRRRPLLAEEAR